jgi:hypothetical protein
MEWAKIELKLFFIKCELSTSLKSCAHKAAHSIELLRYQLYLPSGKGNNLAFRVGNFLWRARRKTLAVVIL